jgi:TolB-like protein/Tfp pilus assembly protein PilF
MSLFEELKRRNVFRVGIAYVVISWLIIQIVETIFPAFGFGDAAVRGAVIVLAIGFIPTLIFAWAFERTPEGIKREKDVDRTNSTTSQTGRKLDRVIIAILVLALGYFAYDKFFQGVPDRGRTGSRQTQSESSQEEGKSIAVLPFTNMSGDPVNEPFTLGIHDDLLTQLSRIRSLKTTSRTSVLQYKDTTKTIPEIAAELGVGNILEGGIQRSGDRVQINLQLIDANTDEHLWAEVYDRELTAENLFAVQGEIATEVAKSMRATLLPAEQSALGKAPTQSMAAYDLYLLGRHHWNQRTAESIEQARDYFQRAIEEDPGYVLAHSGLSDSYALLVSYGNMHGKDAFPLAQEAVDKAMDLDDTLSEVWASQGLIYLLQNQNPKAADTLEQAIELDPQNYSAWLWYANSLSGMRRYEEQLAALQSAYSLEPMSKPVNNNLAGGFRSRGDFVRSRQHFERLDQIDDLNPTEYKEEIATTYYWSGNLTRAVTDARQILVDDPGNTDVMDLLVDTYLALGNIREADRWAKQATKADAFEAAAYKVYLAQGDYDGAIENIEDKLRLIQSRNQTGYLSLLFRAAYLGNNIETAKSYVTEFLGHLGGRVEINPGDTFHWDDLLLADFLIKHGDASNGGAGQGKKMRDEVLAGLTNLNEQNYVHPGTYYGLAQAKAMLGDNPGALDALEQSIERGFRDQPRLGSEPALDVLRSSERFQTLVNRLEDLIAIEQQQLAQTTLAVFTPLSEREIVVLPRETLEKYEGYFSDGNFLLHTYLDDGGKFLLRPGQVRTFEILAISEDEFYTPLVSGQTIEFITDDQGVVTHVLTNNGGAVTRFKAVEPPPPSIEVDRSILERYEGTYAARIVSQAEDGEADSDIWTAVISVAEDGMVYMDLDNQPQLEIRPYSETEFFMPGFEGRMEFKVNAETGIVDRFTDEANGVPLEFIRQ